MAKNKIVEIVAKNIECMLYDLALLEVEELHPNLIRPSSQ
jgi:hypothetical protein